ncbi:serine/threonine-protein kinase 17A isoform X1 [Clarias gariepinus]|uniref:serine/threonine-protein kinase 17A isoform X1 n=1 Tax=Clarias gariepinus TaxID=13013 RepID=UPI00234DCF7F|nr:serine/threonine-protein kinase 17A isoform X1 [Clarias gariepinus]
MIPECPSRSGEARSCGSRWQDAGQSRSGLLRDIQSVIQREPFTEHYTLIPGKELGRGKFAVVKKCFEKSTGREYAAKFMRKRRKGQDCRAEIIHEIAVLELASSCHRVVNLHAVYEMSSEIVLVLEFAAGGEIFNQCVAERDEAFKEEDVKRLMRQILEGVAFLHKNNVVHLDLKPQNILLTSDDPLGDIKIVDFGLSRMVSSNQEIREIMGTPEYVAPEVLNYEPISTATDMWSIGVLAYVMLTGMSPFLGADKQETFLNISQINVSYTEEELEHLDKAAIHFIKSLLIKEPEDRSTAEDCLKHPWLQTQETDSEKEKGSTASSTQSAEEDVEEESRLTEELIVMAAYTLGQCRQSSDKESLTPEQKGHGATGAHPRELGPKVGYNLDRGHALTHPIMHRGQFGNSYQPAARRWNLLRNNSTWRKPCNHRDHMQIDQRIMGGLEPIPGDSEHYARYTLDGVPFHRRAHICTRAHYKEFGNTSQPNLHVFGLWEETRVPGGNQPNTERMCKLHAQTQGRNRTLNPGGARPCSCRKQN